MLKNWERTHTFQLVLISLSFLALVLAYLKYFESDNEKTKSSLHENMPLDNITVNIEGTAINVPAPHEFYEISAFYPDIRRYPDLFAIRTNTLLGVFLPREDIELITKEEIATWNRYLLLQTHKEPKKIKAYKDFFFNELSDAKDKIRNFLKTQGNVIDYNIHDWAGNLSKYYDKDVNVKINDLILLGFFLEEENAFGYCMLVQSQISVGGERVKGTMAVASSIIYTRNRVIFANVYCKYNNTKEIDWAVKTARDWTEQILLKNKL
jgi:hypothetical protein